MTIGVTESELRVGAIRTPLLSVGDPESSEAVVFVHGNPGSSRDWVGLLEAVAPVARGLAWDAPGFGGADKPASFDYTVGGYAEFIDQALDVLGVQRVHLVVHDFGGPWGLRWAVGHPEQFASIVLINTGALVDYSWHTAAKIWRTPLLGELVMATTTRPAFRMLMKAGNPRGLPEDFVDRMYDDFDTPTRKAVLKLYRASPSSSPLMDELSTGLRALDRPALVVWGAKDPYIPVEQADLQLRTFPSAEVQLLDDSGHWPFIDNPQRTQELVVPFLRRVVGS